MSVSDRRTVLFILRVILVSILLQVLIAALDVPNVVLAITAPVGTLVILAVLDWADKHVKLSFRID
ncbi:MAG: hypothetical protein FJ009_06135 [Chloroflexi bacterium]|nr:hypothetical protein [Chloroflexota bacterium]